MDGALFSVIAGFQLAGASLGVCELAPEKRPAALAEYHELANNCLSLPPWPLDFDADLERSFLFRINEERRSAGLPELQLRRQLRAPARFHSLDQIWHEELSHDGIGGRTASDRVGTMDRTLVSNSLQENVGMVGSGNTADGLIDRLHQAFMASDYHRDNILSKTATHMAVGVAVGEDSWYVTQLFAGMVGELPNPLALKIDATQNLPSTVSLTGWRFVGFNVRREEISLPIELGQAGEAELTLIGNRPHSNNEELVYVIELRGPIIDLQKK